MPEPKDLKVGDEVLTMITGRVLSRRAKVTEMDPNRGGRPILEVLLPDGAPDPSWAQFKLKDGDYIIQERWNPEADYAREISK